MKFPTLAQIFGPSEMALKVEALERENEALRANEGVPIRCPKCKTRTRLRCGPATGGGYRVACIQDGCGHKWGARKTWAEAWNLAARMGGRE